MHSKKIKKVNKKHIFVVATTMVLVFGAIFLTRSNYFVSQSTPKITPTPKALEHQCPVVDQNCNYVRGNKEVSVTQDSLNNSVRIPKGWVQTKGTKYEAGLIYSFWHPTNLRFEDHDSGSMVLYLDDKRVFEVYSVGHKKSSNANLDKFYEQSVIESGFYNLELTTYSPKDKVNFSRIGFNNGTLFYKVTYPHFHTYRSEELEPEKNVVYPQFSNYNPYTYYIGKAQGDYFVIVFDYNVLSGEEIKQILANMKLTLK